MPQYMITYLGGDHPSTPEERDQHMTDYRAWLSGLGDAAVSPANPLKDTRTVASNGSVTVGGSTAMSGFTLVAADSIDAAVAMAQACPFLGIGGSLEVSELIQMSG